MTNQLMTNENYMTTYTKPQLIEILEAKATIYIDFYYTSRNFTWVTLRDALPTGYKRLTKAEIVDEIQFYNKVLGVNKAKAEPTATKRTFKLSPKSYYKMDSWAWLQQYLQDNDRHGEWLSMPPTRENVIYVLDVLKRWEDDSAWTGYLTRLLGRDA